MAWPLVALAAVQILGQYQANQAQADAEEKNQKFYNAQADLARAAGIREEQIFLRESAYQRGIQTTSYAGSNIDVSSGSALMAQADSGARALDELNAIRYKNEMEVFLARSRGELSADKVATLRSGSYNFMQAATIGLNTASMYSGKTSGKAPPSSPSFKYNPDMGYFSGSSYPGMGPGIGPYSGGGQTSLLGNYKF
jgi:hypothetical protein